MFFAIVVVGLLLTILVLVLRHADQVRQLKSDKRYYNEQYSNYLHQWGEKSRALDKLQAKRGKVDTELMQLRRDKAELLELLEQRQTIIAGMMESLSNYLTQLNPSIESAGHDDSR